MISLTLKTHKKNNPPGFSSGHLLLTLKFGDTLQSVLNNLNQYRGPDSQITNIYNILGKEIPEKYWGMSIKENCTFYIDVSENIH